MDEKEYDVNEKEEQSQALIPSNIPPPIAVTSSTTIDGITLHQREAGLEILQERENRLKQAYFGSIRLTAPSDWVLFKSRDGAITAYLQDSGCKRGADKMWGIHILNVEGPHEITEGDEYAIGWSGDGECGLTGQRVEGLQGWRRSDDDFGSNYSGINKKIKVTRASRRNLDGNIFRDLSGLGSVPLEHIIQAWEGTSNDANRIALGKGFGGKQERESFRADTSIDKPAPSLGSAVAKPKPVSADATIRASVSSSSPITMSGDSDCPKCGAIMKKRKSKNGEFWGCSKYPGCHGTRPIEEKTEKPEEDIPPFYPQATNYDLVEAKNEVLVFNIASIKDEDVKTMLKGRVIAAQSKAEIDDILHDCERELAGQGQ